MVNKMQKEKIAKILLFLITIPMTVVVGEAIYRIPPPELSAYYADTYGVLRDAFVSGGYAYLANDFLLEATMRM